MFRDDVSSLALLLAPREMWEQAGTWWLDRKQTLSSGASSLVEKVLP